MPRHSIQHTAHHSPLLYATYRDIGLRWVIAYMHALCVSLCRVVCLSCGALTPRQALQDTLIQLNPAAAAYAAQLSAARQHTPQQPKPAPGEMPAPEQVKMQVQVQVCAMRRCSPACRACSV